MGYNKEEMEMEMSKPMLNDEQWELIRNSPSVRTRDDWGNFTVELIRRAWRPISEAPKDEVIYAYDKNNGNIGNVRLGSDREWHLVNQRGTSLDIGFYPTHFMPLPPIPTPDTEV